MDLEDMVDTLKDGFTFFMPVLTVILLASLLGFFATLSATDVEASVFTAEEDASTGSEATMGVFNALLFVLPAALGSFGIVYLIKSGKKKLLKNVFRGMLTVASSVMIMLFFYLFNDALAQRIWYVLYVPPFGAINTIYFDSQTLLYMGVGGLMGGYLLTSIIMCKGFRRSQRNSALIVLSALMGAFMAIILPTWTVVFLLLALAVWDIYAVFKGPIKDLVEMDMNGQLMARLNLRKRMSRLDILGDDSEEFPFQNLTYEADVWALGIGDLVFYSVLGAHSLFYSIPYIQTNGYWVMPLFFVPVVIAILIGFAYTIHRLNRGGEDSILPGLPIPMFLGVGVFCLMMLLASFIL